MKAIFFDLFETLITEWGNEKYTNRMLCTDLNVPKNQFNLYWKSLEYDRYCGNLDYENAIKITCKKCNVNITSELLSDIINKRKKAKASCFNNVKLSIIQMLSEIKRMNYKIGMISNCTSEDIMVIKDSILYPYFDTVILSYELGVAKPQKEIYDIAIKKLNVSAGECIYIGDGGSNELEGARNAGLLPFQALWYLNEYNSMPSINKEFKSYDSPSEVIDLLKNLTWI